MLHFSHEECMRPQDVFLYNMTSPITIKFFKNHELGVSTFSRLFYL